MKDREHALEGAIAECKNLLSESTPMEELIGGLRTQGYSKIDSILILRKAAEISLEKAKEIVHNSATWSDVRIRDEEFHDELVTQMEMESGVAVTRSKSHPSGREEVQITVDLKKIVSE